MVVIIQVLDDMQQREENTGNGYYGMAIENFTCDENLFTAIDETAGNKLFNHIVNSDKTATAFIKELNKKKLPGVFNFIPMNRISPSSYQYPAAKNAFPLKSKLQYSTEMDHVMQFMFGKYLVCRDFPTVVEMARSTGLDCVTLDGEKGSGKGVLSGGYLNPEKSRMRNFTLLTEKKAELFEIQEQKEMVEKSLAELEPKLRQIDAELQRLAYSKDTNMGAQFKLEADERLNKQEVAQLMQQCKVKIESLKNLETSHQLLEKDKSNFVKELDQDMNSQMTDTERSQMENLIRGIEKVRKEFKDMSKEKRHIERRKAELENEATIRLEKQIKEKEIELRKTEERQESLADKRNQLDDIVLKLEKGRQRLAEEQRNEDDVKVKTIQLNLERAENACQIAKEKLDEASIRENQLAQREHKLTNMLKASSKQLAEVGSVPKSALSKYSKIQQRGRLAKDLKSVNQKLKNYSNVNKKALDQYVSFSEERQHLENRNRGNE